MSNLDQFQYDPFSFSLHEDPYPTYRTLRDEFPLYHNPDRGFWALTRFADVQAAARDWQTFSSSAGVDLDGFAQSFGPGNFLNLDPPRHDQLRGLVQKHFIPNKVRELEGRIREIATELLDDLHDHDVVDLGQQFAWPLPVRVISEVLGLPADDRDFLEDRAHELLVRTPDDAQLPQRARDATNEMRGYFAELLAERRRRPRGDLMTHIAQGEVEGERLTDEAVGLCLILFSAGIDTTASLMTNSLVHLAGMPDVRARLAANPSQLPAAIEELLRFESPVQSLARITARPVVLHGQVVPAGERVSLVYGAANRDEREFPDPDRLDFDRAIRRHLAFGDGIHFCIGGPVARLEARIAFELLFVRIPEYEIQPAVERVHHHTLRGLTRLPAVIGKASAPCIGTIQKGGAAR